MSQTEDKKIRIISMRSVLFTSVYGIIVLFCLSGAAIAAHKTSISLFLIVIAVLSAVSRAWALNSLKNVEFSVDASKCRFFPDEKFSISLKVHNNKNIPVMWFETAIPLEDNCPVLPVNENDIYMPDGLTKADEELPRCPMLRKRFAFVMPWQKLKIDVSMRAVHRGVYRFDRFRVYSGDGLGLSQAGMSAEEGEKVFAVYPAFTEMNTELFMNTQWLSSGKSKGYFEDSTLIRGNREYQPSDSWKRINWRMAARGLPLNVNLPEMILPQGAHFIVDGESFGGPEPDDSGFELMLSVLGSIFIKLSDAGLSCGLTLPDSRCGSSRTYRSGTPVPDLLFALASYERKVYKEAEEGQNITEVYSYYDSSAVLGAYQTSGKIYFITRNIRYADTPVLRHFPDSSLIIMTLEEPAEQEKKRCGRKTVSIKSLLKR